MMKSKHGKTWIRKGILFLTLTNLLLISAPLISHGANTEYFVKYRSDSEGEIDIEIGAYEIWDTEHEEWDLDNLIILPGFSCTIWNIGESYQNEDARRHLLYYGYAKLEDESIATEWELEAQEHAKQNFEGIWEENKSDEEGTLTDESEMQTEGSSSEESAEAETGEEKAEGFGLKVRAVLRAIVSWVAKNYQWVLSLGVISALGGAFLKRFRTRKRRIILGGWKGCGKTTLKLLLMNPDASIEELKSQSPTLKPDIQRIVRDDNNNKLVLEAEVLDPPGMELQYIVNALVKSGKNGRRKSVVVLMLSPTAAVDARQRIDYDHIKEQLVTLEKLWKPILLSEVAIKLQAVVLFINKSDLFADDPEKLSELFTEHTKLIKTACESKGIRFKTICGSVINKAGITELLNTVKER